MRFDLEKIMSFFSFLCAGAKLLLTKLQYYKPKIAVFNGKGIYEIYSKKKDFNFGKQPETVEGTSTVGTQIVTRNNKNIIFNYY